MISNYPGAWRHFCISLLGGQRESHRGASRGKILLVLLLLAALMSGCASVKEHTGTSYKKGALLKSEEIVTKVLSNDYQVALDDKTLTVLSNARVEMEVLETYEKVRVDRYQVQQKKFKAGPGEVVTDLIVFPFALGLDVLAMPFNLFLDFVLVISDMPTSGMLFTWTQMTFSDWTSTSTRSEVEEQVLAGEYFQNWKTLRERRKLPVPGVTADLMLDDNGAGLDYEERVMTGPDGIASHQATLQQPTAGNRLTGLIALPDGGRKVVRFVYP